LRGKTAEFSVPPIREHETAPKKKAIPEIRQSNFRKWLWLIPFTLAKKLLTVAQKKFWGKDPLVQCQPDAYNNKNQFGR
jgi:hypothetical protein